MRRAIVIASFGLSLFRFDLVHSKILLRRLIISLCRGAIDWSSRPYMLGEGTTLVFAPHQDDETLGCGALIARMRNDGLSVQVVFLTDGSASHPGHPAFSPAEIAALRHQEARQSLHCLGVESCAIHFLDEPDGTLDQLTGPRRETLEGRLVELLTVLQPRKIFLPYNRDGSTEHDAAFVLINEAIKTSKCEGELWQYPVWAWWNLRSLLRLVLVARKCCRQPTEDYGAAKEQALRCYASQTEPLPPWPEPTLPPELVRVFRFRSEYFFRYFAGPRKPSKSSA